MVVVEVVLVLVVVVEHLKWSPSANQLASGDELALHDIAMTNIVWCMAYKRGVGGLTRYIYTYIYIYIYINIYIYIYVYIYIYIYIYI